MKKFLLFASAVALLAGCSKELTEEATPVQVTGKSTIYATYDGGADGTRTHLVPNGKSYKIKWDAGDAVGVFNYDVKGDDANSFFAYTKGEDNISEFRGDMTLLDATAYVAYYPYYSEAVIDPDGNLKINIPAKQNYRTVTDNPDGTFAANVAPAVAYGETVTENSLEVTFHPLATYVQIPIQGIGSINSLKLTIGAGDTFKPLAGAVTVNVADVAEGKINPVMDVNGATSIVLNCGKNGVNLSQEKPAYFWFVIPAGTDLYGQTMTLTINEGKGTLKRVFDYTSSRKTPVNTPIELGQSVENDEAVPFEWIEDAEDKYVIKTEGEFIKYAYLASNQTPDSVEEDEVALAMLREDGTLKDAMIVNPLDFSQFTVSTNKDDYEGDAALFNAFEDAVYYSWYYQTNGMGISSIGGDKNYAIIGNGKLGVIQNLNVIGNGVFVDSKDVPNAAPVVSNIVLKNTTVTSKEEAACFVTENVWYFNTLNVTVDGGELKATTAKSTALFNNVQSCKLVDESFNIELTNDAYPIGVALYANSLDVYADMENAKNITLGSEFFTADGEDVLFLFGQVVAQKPNDTTLNGSILTVSSSDAAKAVINKINKDADYAGGWFSVVTRKADKKVDTSYWTGFNATTRDNGDGVVTAEELFYNAWNGTNSKLVLTNNIDLDYKPWNIASILDNNKKSIEIDGAGFKILRGAVTNGLFGPKTDVVVKNLKVGPTFVEVVDKDATPYLLAKGGTAEKVEAEILTYRYNNGVESAKDGIVAGLFYEGTIDQLVKTTGCEVSGATKYCNKELTDKFGALYAKVKVPMGHKYSIPAYNIGNYNPFVELNVYTHEGNDTGHGRNLYLTFEGFTSADGMPLAKELVRWTTGGFNPGEQVIFLYKNEPESGHGNAAVYDGTEFKVTDSDNLNDILDNIPDNVKNVTIALPGDEYAFEKVGNASTLPKGKTLTFVGNGNTVLSNIEYIEAEGSTIEFKDLTISVGNSGTNTSIKVTAKEVKFTNVTINGMYYTSAETETTFENCEFHYGGSPKNDWRAGLWIESKNATIVNNCVFDMTKDGPTPASAICVNNDTTSGKAPVTGDVTVTNCTFKGSVPSNDAAIQINSTKFSGNNKKSTLTVGGNTVDTKIFKGGEYKEVNNSNVATTFYTVVKK